MRISVGDFKLGAEEKKSIYDVIEKGRLSEGEKVKEFEKKWADFVGTQYATLVSSGTAALMTGLTAVKYAKDLGDKRKVITAPLTYIATINALVTTGFEPVFVDVDKKTFGITGENVSRHLEKVNDKEKYAIILPVHLMGYPVNMEEINKIASKYGLITVEDSAQSHGSFIGDRKAGSLSLFSIFSFYIAHNIQAGEMGAINTDDVRIWKLNRKIKTHGRMCDCAICRRAEGNCPRLKNDKNSPDPRFTHDVIGYNFKVMEFQAALGLTQLKRADFIIKKRLENVRYLNEHLNRYSHLMELPLYDEKVSYLAYPLIIKDKRLSRRQLLLDLEKRGVETRPLFGSVPTQQPAYSYMKNDYENKLSNADYLGANGFYIGCHQYLERKDLDYIIEIFEEILGDMV